MKQFITSLFAALLILTLSACELSSPKTYDIDEIIDEITITYREGDDADHVTGHLGVPQTYKNDPKVDLSWTTSDLTVVDRFGTVNRPENDTHVTLVLTVTIGTESREKRFDLTVLGTIVRYDWTFVADGMETIISQTEGAFPALPEDPEKDGFVFVGWSLDEAIYTPLDTDVPVTGEETLHAFFEDESLFAEVVITIHLETVEGGTYDILEPVTITTEPDLTYTYDEERTGFVLSQDSVASGITSLQQPLELTIYYDRVSHMVTYVANGETVEELSVRHGATADDIPYDLEGFIFNGWTLDGLPYDFASEVTGPLELVADLEEEQSDVYEGYYASINGLSGEALFDELSSVLNATVDLVTYGDARYMLDDTDRDPENASNVILVYTGNSVSGNWDFGATWNREHVWPQSLLGVSASNGTANRASDLQNLKPANPSVNSSRGNKYYDNYTTSASYAPRDEVKGDLARILFYMVVMYDDMTLVNGSPGVLQMALFSRMFEWHEADPVDDFERDRNDAIYGYQDNRNPFIDHPELVREIWGDVPGSTSRTYDLSSDSVTVIVYRPETDLSVFSRKEESVPV
jgi:endonuclease I